MTRTSLALALLLASLAAAAQPAGKPQYISDEVTVTVREAPRLDAPSLGAVKSGARVTLLESLGPESYARIRTADGRVGWITARYLSAEPAAREQLVQRRAELDGALGQIRTLERELESARQQLAKARPAFELAQDNDRLRASIASLEQERTELARRYDTERARRSTLIAGASLVGAGILAGLVLPWLGRGKRRRYNEL